MLKELMEMRWRMVEFMQLKNNMKNLNNQIEQIISTKTSVYDSFNELMFCNDIKVLSKFIAKVKLLDAVKNIPGDIVECGVFKGSGIVAWLKIKEVLQPNSFKKVIGFDFFDTDSLIKSLNGDDLHKMEKLFNSRKFKHNEGFEQILTDKIKECGFNDCQFELIKGDVNNTCYDFVSKRPGFKISLLYLDLDLGTPTYNTLSAFWDKVSRGGIVVFDEYAYHQWSESIGADKFFQDKNIVIKTLDYGAPTAYVLKP